LLSRMLKGLILDKLLNSTHNTLFNNTRLFDKIQEKMMRSHESLKMNVLLVLLLTHECIDDTDSIPTLCECTDDADRPFSVSSKKC